MKKLFSLGCILLILTAISCKPKEGSYLFLNGDPAIAGFDVQKLNQLTDSIVAGSYGQIRSMLILRNDKIVFERYFRNWNPDSLQPVWSVTKSFVATMLGIVRSEGYLDNLDAPVKILFPDYEIAYQAVADSVTLHHLLTMTSGFDWTKQNADPVLVKSILKTPLAHVPGSYFEYNGFNTHLVSALIQQSVNKSTAQYANEKLFIPLGITDWRWESDPQGVSVGGAGLHLKPRDMLKFGYLYLKNGKWKDEQLISPEWIKLSTTPMVGSWTENMYGYQWNMYSGNHPVVKMLSINDVYAARGAGDQYIWIIPHLDMVVVTTAGNFDKKINSQHILWDGILPALRDR